MSVSNQPLYKWASLAAIKAQIQFQLATPLFLPETPAVAPRTPASLSAFEKIVQDGYELLPARYHATYVDVLSQAVAQVQKIFDETATGGGTAKKRRLAYEQLCEIFASLAAPIVQLKSDKSEGNLKAYLALSSNFYQRFMLDDDVRRANSRLDSWPQIDPLGHFVSPPDTAFSTLPPSADLPFSLVSKPVAMAHCSPLWVIDAHEVGGHGIHSVVEGFENEVGDSLFKALAPSTAPKSRVPRAVAGLISEPGEKRVPERRDLLAHLLRGWSTELAADVAGLLNCGPMFANGLMLYFVTQNTDGLLRNTAKILPRDRLDGHPPDLFRALVMVACVKRLPLADNATIVQSLMQRLSQCAGEIPETFEIRDESGMIQLSLPYDELAATASVVARTLMSAPLKTLGGRGMSDVFTWSAEDETITTALARRLSESAYNAQTIESDVQARHLASAALLATEQACRRENRRRLCARIQSNCEAALKDFYLEQCILCAMPDYTRSRKASGNSAKTARRLAGGKSLNLTDLLHNLRRSKFRA